jgi:hypothetical protein
MGERCDKCKNDTRTTQLILGYIICTQCAEELRRMVSRWVNPVTPANPILKEVPRRKASR